jgi:L-ascorbate metabolism protein UlaG (beta-lactamase superfamily)
MPLHRIMWRERPFSGQLAQELASRRTAPLSLYWLGQAGFVLDAPGLRILIDPYLSDSLARKYRGTDTPHERMTQAPISFDALGNVNLILCTHQHTDHMDGDTLRPLGRRLKELRFMVPAAASGVALERTGVLPERLILADAGEVHEVFRDRLRIHVMRAAHETLERDAEGHYRFLGYGLEVGGYRIFHSGDTVTFPGQIDEIRAFAPHLMLLPVNGRSTALRGSGIAGNLTLAEAVELTGACGAPSMLAHHFGMFAFNTADPAVIELAAAAAPFQMFVAAGHAAIEPVT